MEQHERPDGFTYVSGLGFVPAGQSPERGDSPDGIRRMSNLLCLCLFLYFLSERLFKLPLTYLAYLLGLDVRINRFTGMIVQTRVSETVVSFFTNAASMLVVFLLVMGMYRHAVREAHICQKPFQGVLPLALPMTLSCGVLGLVCGSLLGRAMELFGLVVSSGQRPVYRLSPETISALVTYLLFAAFQELLFRGVMLAPLRRFGDGFAIIASAMLYAVWSEGVIGAVSGFVFGICAAYFVVRSGSVLTAVLGRCSLVLLVFGFRLLSGVVEQSLASVVAMVAGLLLATWAVLAYVRFVKLDENAFRLVRLQGSLSTRMRLGAFCGSICFILLLVAMLLRVVNTIQIIG